VKLPEIKALSVALPWFQPERRDSKGSTLRGRRHGDPAGDGGAPV